MLERWVVTARTNEEAPPAYTPRGTEEHEQDKKEKDTGKGKEKEKATGVEHHHSGARRVVVHEPVPVPEQEVKSYGYRPVKKPLRKPQKKHDRMLILFWIPILFSKWPPLHALLGLFLTQLLRTPSWSDLGVRAFDAGGLPCYQGGPHAEGGTSSIRKYDKK